VKEVKEGLLRSMDSESVVVSWPWSSVSGRISAVPIPWHSSKQENE
jgi:hypothetical protein